MKKIFLFGLLLGINLQAGMTNDFAYMDGQNTIKNYFSPVPSSYYYTDSKDVCTELVNQFIDNKYIGYEPDWIEGCTLALRSARQRGKVLQP